MHHQKCVGLFHGEFDDETVAPPDETVGDAHRLGITVDRAGFETNALNFRVREDFFSDSEVERRSLFLTHLNRSHIRIRVHFFLT